MYGKKKGDPDSVWSYIFPHDLTIDREGHVFWAEFQGQHLGQLDPKTGKIERYPLDPEGVRGTEGIRYPSILEGQGIETLRHRCRP